MGVEEPRFFIRKRGKRMARKARKKVKEIKHIRHIKRVHRKMEKEEEKKKIKIPYSFLPYPLLRKLSGMFKKFGKRAAKKGFDIKLKQANLDARAEDYVSASMASSFFTFIILAIIFLLIFYRTGFNLGYGALIAFVLSIFIYSQQMNYPKLLAYRRIRDIEKNLLPALRALLVQLNSGLTFFDALNNIARGKYGLISIEFGKSIRDMETGTSTVNALERISRDNPSVFFRRIIWQITTGMQAGSDISSVLKEIISSLSTEQLTDIQAYGARLSPLTMFYMLIAIILPSLSITFVVVLSSFLPLLGQYHKIVLYTLIAVLAFIQVMFLGMIKAKRPALA